MEHSLGLITLWATNQALVNLRKWRSYQASFPTMTLYDWKSTERKKTAKNTNMWKLNNMLLTNQWITEEIKEESKKMPTSKQQQRHNNPNPKPMGCSKSSSKR